MATKGLTKFVLNRNYVLGSTFGHSVLFEKDVPTFVPAQLISAALAIGALPEDGQPVEGLHEKPPEGSPPTDPAERSALILMAIESLAEKNLREDFTAAGSPTVDAVTREIGFRVQAREIALAWQKYHDKKAGENQ